MSGTYMHPTAGNIMDFGSKADPVPISVKDRAYLRELALRIQEIAMLPVQAERKRLWTAHNDLQPGRPLFVVYPEDGWNDLVGPNNLILEHPFWRNCEWYLKHLIYRHENIVDDFVTEPDMTAFVAYEIINGDYGLPITGGRSISSSGAWVHDPPMKDYMDIQRMMLPEFRVNEARTLSRIVAMEDVFADILAVHPYVTAHFSANQPGHAASLRGIQQIMLDMYDDPASLHDLLDILTRGSIKLFKEMEASGWLRLNNRNHYVDAGGNGYTADLPKSQNSSQSAQLSDLWGYGVAQEYSEISPQMHDEFGIAYQAKVLELFGLNAYGCCEPYTQKFDILGKISNLRRVSVSPWCDITVAAEKLGHEIIYSWKPNPAIVLLESDISKIRNYIRKTIDTTRGCIVEIFLKDIIHLKGFEQRIKDFSVLLREETSDA